MDRQPISEQWALADLARAHEQGEYADGERALQALRARIAHTLDNGGTLPELPRQWDNTGLAVSYNPCARYWACDNCGREHAPGLMRVVFGRNEHGQPYVAQQTCIVVCEPPF